MGGEGINGEVKEKNEQVKNQWSEEKEDGEERG